jgi:alcohol dehydrogenase
MKAAIFKGKGKIEIEQRPRPQIKESTDAIVAVVLSCVCGSDLWYYRGIEPHKEGPIGHEFIGLVEQTGVDVKDIKKGDFVIAPFAFSDNTCPHCMAGFQTACMNGGFFGMGDEGLGGQAEYVRVPQAGGTLVPVAGSSFSDETLASLLTLSDVMATGFHAAISAEVKTGDTAAIVGDGAVGLSGILAAKLLQAGRVIVLGSTHKERQQLASQWGADEFISIRGQQAIDKLMQLTGGVGADAVLECVGTNEANQMAFAIARPGAVVGRVGVPHDVQMDARGIFFANVGTKGGPAPVRRYLPKLLDAVLEGRINPGEVFDFKSDLDHIQDAYQVMDQRKAIKSLIKVRDI